MFAYTTLKWSDSVTHFNLEALSAIVNKRGVRMRNVISHDHATVRNLMLEADAISLIKWM
ncbi:MAG: hypothetical protein ACOCU0_03615 [Bacillota bacterium]